MASEGPGKIEARQILLGITGNGYIVVVDEQRNLQVMRHRMAGRFGVVSFLLGAVAAEKHDVFVRIGPCNAVYVGEHVPKPARAELDAEGSIELGVPVEAFARGSIVVELFHGHLAVHRGERVLNRHAVARLVEGNGYDLARAAHEAFGDENFRDDVVWTAGVSGQSFPGGNCGIENDQITEEGNVLFEMLLLCIAELRLFKCERKRAVPGYINRKICHMASCLPRVSQKW